MNIKFELYETQKLNDGLVYTFFVKKNNSYMLFSEHEGHKITYRVFIPNSTPNKNQFLQENLLSIKESIINSPEPEELDVSSIIESVNDE